MTESPHASRPTATQTADLKQIAKIWDNWSRHKTLRFVQYKETRQKVICERFFTQCRWLTNFVNKYLNTLKRPVTAIYLYLLALMQPVNFVNKKTVKQQSAE